MQQKQIDLVKKIQSSYGENVNDSASKMNVLKSLDKKVKRPAQIFAYVYGSISSLVLGTGMCLCMGVIGTALAYAMPLGVGVGVAGIALALTTYPLFKKILKSRKKKYSEQILALSNDLLNE